ncbi:hypothetical protein NP493_1009g01008 [Ridgeia piscesae]|uniref:Uncharacterized protein n=1 Tax=Ridgeia piscesae TaxID=27915 RepID=A0AAD9KK15_RIDPI|nr:hypothetical protein NP493_1009g01008 [Ridgeia piscesae]
MDDISALLRHLVQTKSIERALAPIATQISQLIMTNEAFENGERDTFPDDLVSRSTSVRESAAELVRASELVALDTKDEVTKRDMTRASELLDVSADSLVTATHRVYVDNMSHQSRRHLIRAAKDLLEGTLKVLLVSDDAKVRKIVTCTRRVLSHLQDMTGVRTVPQLVVCFKSFTDELAELVSLLDKRQNNLIDPHQREHIIVAMTTLKKCVPMLKSSMQTFVKYPKNPQVLASREYSVGQVIESLHAVIDLVEGRQPIDDTQTETSGYFVTAINKLMNQLSEINRPKWGSPGGELDSLIEGAVSHSMAVAHLSTSHHSDLIRKNCQRVFRQLTHVTELHKNVTSSPEFTQLQLDFGDACDCLIEELRDLQRHSSAAVLHLVMDVFKETTEPLSRLLRFALSTSQLQLDMKVSDKDVKSDREAKHVTEQSVESLIDAFQRHAELMCQVSRVVAAGSLHSKSVRTINGCVTQLEQLDPEIVPAILAVCHHGDRVTLEDVRLLTQEWTNNVELLVAAIDGTIDERSFIEISGMGSQLFCLWLNYIYRAYI